MDENKIHHFGKINNLIQPLEEDCDNMPSYSIHRSNIIFLHRPRGWKVNIIHLFFYIDLGDGKFSLSYLI